jgi:hypothetical protein
MPIEIDDRIEEVSKPSHRVLTNLPSSGERDFLVTVPTIFVTANQLPLCS